jgi:hypothetical protein
MSQATGSRVRSISRGGKRAVPAGARFNGRAAWCLALLWGAMPAPARAEVAIERTYLADAAPSSFAIGLPGGINFCFDPVRGGVSYAWTGGFLDLAGVRPGPGKFLKPALPLGPIVYREAGAAPLRRGDPARTPVVEFTGYVLRAEAVEFRYTVDGVPVREEIRAISGGGGLLRRFQVEAGGDARWWQVVEGRPATELKRDATGAFVLEIPFTPASP